MTTTITMQKTTKDRIALSGRFGESYEDVINRVLDELEDKREK